MSLITFVKNLFKTEPANLVHFTCPRCGGDMSALATEDPYPVYCAPCDKTYIAESELVESHPITWEDRLTGDYYLGAPVKD